MMTDANLLVYFQMLSVFQEISRFNSVLLPGFFVKCFYKRGVCRNETKSEICQSAFKYQEQYISKWHIYTNAT